MSCKLNPLSWKKFDEMHRKAWENGWTYGPAFAELYLDYIENWGYFQYYLDDLIESNKNKDNFTLNLLIGEAPPQWSGKNIQRERSYFYNPNHLNNTQNWLDKPFNYFHRIKQTKSAIESIGKKAFSKQEKLSFLAKNGVVLIDIFPFPVIQQTEVRKKITKHFSNFVSLYFIQHIQKIKAYIACKTKIDIGNIIINCALMTPEITSLQLMYDPGLTKNLIDLNLLPMSILDSKGSAINIVKISKVDFGDGIGILKEDHNKSKFLKAFTPDKKPIKINACDLEKFPILINGRTPEFETFFNSSEKIILEKFGTKK